MRVGRITGFSNEAMFTDATSTVDGAVIGGNEISAGKLRL